MNAQELKETGQRLLKSGQYADAIPLLKTAAEALPKNESLWQELVVAARDNGHHEQAVEFAKLGIRHHPRSDWLWLVLGGELVAIDRLDEAEKALKNSENLNSHSEWLWRYTANLHRKHKNPEGEEKALEQLAVLKKATPSDFHALGNTYYNKNDFDKALRYYRLAFTGGENLDLLFNMALVFMHPEVSQDVDAADVYRRILSKNPNYISAVAPFERIKSKLAALAQKARPMASALVRRDERFQFYISPFEAFQFDKMESNRLDVKEVQRAKKRLLQEIELEGKVSWLEDYALDKSLAVTLDDELLDESKRRYHWAVFQNKRLLYFLTRGDIEHFLYSDDYFPLDTLKLLDEQPAFRTFISKPFARQYNLVLTHAIEKQALGVVEALFDGRRWVEPEDEDVCFEGAYKYTNLLMEWMEKKVGTATSAKPDYSLIAAFIENKKVAETLNLLPTAFCSVQNQFVGHIRLLAIATINKHSDAESSARIIGLCKKFSFKSVDLKKRLEEDFKVILKIALDNCENSFCALVRKNETISIAHVEIKFADNSINAADVEAIRWGIYVHTVNGAETEHSFTLVVKSAHKCVQVRWDRRGFIGDVKKLFRNKDAVVPISQMQTADQEVYFHKMIDAVMHHLIPSLIAKVVQRLRSGIAFNVGTCALSQTGVAFRTGLIFRKDHLLPWGDVETQMHNGQVIVFSKTNRKAQVSMTARDIDNAVILPILCAAMCD